MGPAFVMLFWAIVLTPVGLILGALLSLVVIPFVLKRRRGPRTKGKIGFLGGLGLTLLVCALFVPTMVCLGAYLMEKDLDDYWASRGAWDWWRMPLEYPYDLIAVGDLDEGTIRNWEDRSQYVHGITRFYKNGDIVVGEISSSWSNRGGWFSFDCGSGRVVWYTSEGVFRQALKELGLGRDLELLTVEENIHLYWRNH